MVDFIVLGIILIVLGAAIAYIVKTKKSGARCIGCPDGGSCSGKCASTGDSECSCGCHSEK